MPHSTGAAGPRPSRREAKKLPHNSCSDKQLDRWHEEFPPIPGQSTRQQKLTERIAHDFGSKLNSPSLLCGPYSTSQFERYVKERCLSTATEVVNNRMIGQKCDFRDGSRSCISSTCRNFCYGSKKRNTRAENSSSGLPSRADIVRCGHARTGMKSP